MTVALIREPEGADTMEVAFSESARFYRLSQANPEFEKILATLREAKEKNRPIYVLLESRHSDVIVDVKHSS